MISNSIRNFIALLLWLALALVCLYVNVQVTIANYLGCKSALELQGYEMQPLRTDTLVGQLLGSFFGEATLAQFFALGVALVMSLSLFFLFNIAFGLFDLFEIRKEHDDLTQVRAANRRIILSVVKIAFILGFLYWAVSWDLDLFRFRSVAGAIAAGEPEIDPLKVPSWANFVTTHDNLFVKELIGVGAWGYLAITALGCFLLEESFEKLTERWARLMAPVDSAVDGWFAPAQDADGQEVFYGYDQDGQPVYDPETPIAYDTDGNPIEEEEETVVRPRTEAESTRVIPEVVFNAAEALPVTPIVPSSEGSNGHADALFEIPQANQTQQSAGTTQAEEVRPGAARFDLRDVIGTDGEQVTLAAALADRGRYYVDQSSGQIWDRKHWEGLHGLSTEPKAA
jgi:hypothetical protein